MEARPKKTTTYPDMPPGVLAGLLDLRGQVDEISISPRRLLGRAEQFTPRQLAELVEGGVLTRPEDEASALAPRFSDVAFVLLHPRSNLTLRAWSSSQAVESNIQFPGMISEGGGVVMNQVERRYRVTAFAGRGEVLEFIRKGFLNYVGAAVQMPFEAHFDAPLAAAFFGVVDLARREAFAKLAGQSSTQVLGWSGQEIIEFILSSWGTTATDQYLTAVMVAGGYGAPPLGGEIERALGDLSRAGMIDLVDGRWVPREQLQGLIQVGMMIEGGLQWQRASLLLDGSLAISNRIVLKMGKDSLLCIDRSVEGKVFVHSMSYDSLVDFFADEFTCELPLYGDDRQSSEPPPRSESAPVGRDQPDPGRPTCHGCKAVLEPAVSFCTHCGANVGGAVFEPPTRRVQRLPETARTPLEFCPVCAGRLAPGILYCMRCGAPTKGSGHLPHSTAVSPLPAVAQCPRCSAALEPGISFCTICGLKVEAGAPVMRVCASCRSPLTPELLFCTTCGHRVS